VLLRFSEALSIVVRDWFRINNCFFIINTYEIMGLRIHKRINLGKGVGINISKSGISPSIRTKRGTLSTKSFSVRTGIPGLTYRKTFSTAKGKGCLLQMLICFGILTFLTYKLSSL